MAADEAIDPIAARKAVLSALRDGDLAEAVARAEAARSVWPDDATLAFGAARALLGVGRAAEALEPFRLALAQDPEHPDWWVRAYAAARSAEDRPAMLEFALCGAERHIGDLALQRIAARLAFSVEHPKALVLLERLLELTPADAAIHRLAGQLAARAGRTADAIGHLTRSTALDPTDPVAYGALADALRIRGDDAGAVTALEALTRLQPDSPLWWRRLASALRRCGLEAEAVTALERSLALRRLTLPEDLVSGLEALWTTADEHRIAESRLDWAWSVQAKRSDPAPWSDRAAWERAAKWGAIADDLLIDWAEIYPDRVAEIAAIAELRGVERLTDPLRSGRGVLLAIAHIGPTMGGPVVLDHFGVPFGWVSSNARIGNTPLWQSLISTQDGAGAETIRAEHATLRAGRVLLVAMDSDPARPATVPFEGQMIRINPIGSLLIHGTGAAALFLDSRWVDGRMVFEVLPMVEPAKGESLPTFQARWTEDYLDKLRRNLFSHPVNMKCRGGLWSSIRPPGTISPPPS